MGDKSYYLRMEGVNLDNFVDDTSDLSTIRGGSLLLLEAVERVKQRFALEAVSTGASSGTFRLNVAGSEAAGCLRQDVEKFLNDRETPPDTEPLAFKYATFVVDVLETDTRDSFVKTREQLLALNRWQQMQAPSLAIPAQQTAQDICRIDRLRPAVDTLPDGRTICASVKARRQYGREQKKQDFYKQRIGVDRPDRFANDFQELTDRQPQALHGKMAVVYMDGNGFTQIQGRHCTKKEIQHDFDERLQNYRKELFRTLLESTRDKRDWLTKDNRYRMETLLWGGDDMLWAVPAWVGWSFISCIYSRMQDWEFGQEPLKHAAGLVFCHHNAPIDRIKRLAEGLAGLAKDKDRKVNYLAYQVLESFDHAGLNLKKFRHQRCPKGIEPDEMILCGDTLYTVLQPMATVKRGLPHRTLHRIATTLFEQTADQNNALLTDLWQTLEDKSPERKSPLIRAIDELDHATRQALCDLSVCFGQRTLWLHLADLWDYLD